MMHRWCNFVTRTTLEAGRICPIIIPPMLVLLWSLTQKLLILCFVLCRNGSIDTLEIDVLDISIASSQHVNKIRSEMEVAPHNKLYFKQCSHSVIHCLVLTLLQCQCRPLSQKHRPPSLPHITCRGVSSRLNDNDKQWQDARSLDPLYLSYR